MTNLNRVQRSLSGMTLGLLADSEKRKAIDKHEGLMEFDQQYQLTFSGEGWRAPVWSEVEVSFGAVFVDSPEMRETPYGKPTFTYGVQTADFILMQVSLVKYYRDESLYFTGAQVRVGVWIPFVEMRDAQKFSGILHLNFQGYGAIAQDEDTSE